MNPCDALTRRQQDVLACVVKGYTNRAIAEELSISVATVENHLHDIFRTLQVTSRTQAAVCALERGLVTQKGGVYESVS